MVTGDTKRVLIESATFDPVSVRKTARAMGISTDASYTFERGADVDNVLLGLKRALFLLGGASTGEGAHCTGFTYSEGKPTEKRKVPFSIATLKKQLTLPRLQEAEVVARLKNLGFICEVIPSEKPSEKDHRYSVTVPSWRLFDVRNEEDLIEEFARVHGLNKVKMELPPLDPETPVENEIETVLKRVEGVLHGAGFVEVITKSMYSQVEVDLLEKLSPGTKEKHVSLKNALERNNSHLRITNVISLARLAETNHRKGVLSCKMYEVTRLFSLGLEGGEGYEYERDVLSLAVSGRWNLHEWRQEEEVSQIIFKVKGVLEGVFKALGVNVTVSQGDKDILHPGIQGTLSVGRTKVGFFGVIHPEIKDAVECSHPCIYAEIDLRAASKVSQEREFASPSEFPSVRRDLTFKVSERELAGRVVKFISEMKLDNFVSAIITDDFKRESEEFRRVTYRITFNSKERTLAHGEVDLAVQEILTRLKDEHRIELAQ